MSYEAEVRQLRQNSFLRMTDTPQVSSSVGDNFIYGVGQTVDYNLSISENIVRGFDIPFTNIRFGGNFDYDKRDDQLNAMRKDGTLSDDEWTTFTSNRQHGRGRILKTDYNALAQYVNDRDGTNIRTNEQIDDAMRATLKERKAQADDIFRRQTGMGAMAQFAGGFAGYGLEPMNLAAMVAEPILLAKNAYALSQASTRLGRGLIAGRTAATVGIVSEAAIQPILFNWNEKIGEDMTWSDALVNIASVGVLSGSIGVVASAARTKARFEAEQVASKLSLADKKISAGEFAGLLRSIRSATKNVVDDPEADDLLKQAENAMRGSDPDTPAEEVLQTIDDTDAQINAQTTKANEYDEYTYDDATIDRDFDALIQLDAEPGGTGILNLDDKDLGADAFGFDELTPKQEGKKAIEQIEAMYDRARILDICLTGGSS